MVEHRSQFCFPKISKDTTNLHSLAIMILGLLSVVNVRLVRLPPSILPKIIILMPIVKAVNQVVELFTSESKLFCDEYKNQGILSSSSLKAKD